VRDQDDDQWLRAVAEAQPAFSGFLGIRITFFSRDCVEGELTVRPELANRNGVLHGGALIGFADNLGGTAASLNLPRGSRTTTLESKTNFFRPLLVGSTARARCVPLHRGRTTSVWQTTVTAEDGRARRSSLRRSCRCTRTVPRPPAAEAPARPLPRRSGGAGRARAAPCAPARAAVTELRAPKAP
jgi:1,4-dihydroxy-2-naphthoyl-CoA hydrolase